MHARKLLVASMGIAAADVACSNERSVGNGMSFEVDSYVGPFDTDIADSGTDTSVPDAGADSDADVIVETDADVLDGDASKPGDGETGD
jgi:hypothetical protein